MQIQTQNLIKQMRLIKQRELGWSVYLIWGLSRYDKPKLPTVPISDSLKVFGSIDYSSNISAYFAFWKTFWVKNILMV